MRVGVRTDRAVASSEPGDAIARVLPLVFRHMHLEDIAHHVPELVVVVLEEHDETSRLGIERAGGVLDRGLDDGFDAVVGDGSLLVQGINASSKLGGFEEFVCVEAHFRSGCGKMARRGVGDEMIRITVWLDWNGGFCSFVKRSNETRKQSKSSS